MNKSLHNLQSAVLLHDVYWSIEPKAADNILAQLGATDAKAHQEEYQQKLQARRSYGSEREEKPYEMRGATAVMYMSGPMTKKGSSFGSGGTIQLRNDIRHAAMDNDVRSVLLVWDTPGGAVAGTAELAADIAMLAAKKRCVSFYEDTCCSAGLWAGSMASEVYCNAMAIVGSIGVFSYAIDASKWAENEGIKVHMLTTGKYKGAGAVPAAGITDEQLAEMQRTVETFGAHFRAAIARGRNMSVEKVEELADGRVWIGQEAVDMGLVDGIATFDDVLQSMNQPAPRFRAEDDFSPEAVLPAGATLDTALNSVLAAVEGVTVRCESLRTLRAEQGRMLSSERVQQIEQLAEGLTGLAERCRAPLSTSSEPSPEDASPDPQDEERNARLDRALEASAALLTT